MEERSRDTDALSWWTEQGLSPIAARRAAVRHWRKTRERRESHFRKQAAIYAEVTGVSVETAVERALAARDEYLSQFSAEARSRIQARKERSSSGSSNTDRICSNTASRFWRTWAIWTRLGRTGFRSGLGRAAKRGARAWRTK